jgi:hypothetical protein
LADDRSARNFVLQRAKNEEAPLRTASGASNSALTGILAFGREPFGVPQRDDGALGGTAGCPDAVVAGQDDFFKAAA